ncbi:MAG TPA: hypothetical protein VM925_13515 [Labilithrix sp.]|nr:hypothetical protein [Labilithrix sp.]
MHRDLIQETEFLRFAPRGEMAVVADTDADEESDDEEPDTIPNPSIPIVPHVRVVTRNQDRLDRERASDEGMTPPSA